MKQHADQIMLSELIELAVHNGYKELIFRPKAHTVSLLIGDMYAVMGLLFSHEFAKAVFGDKDVVENNTQQWVTTFCLKEWQYHLQQLAITPEDKRIEYVYQNRRTV